MSCSGKAKLSVFHGSLAELTRIQNEFFSDRPRFLYFRKGEAENNVPVALRWLNEKLISRDLESVGFLDCLEAVVHAFFSNPSKVAELLWKLVQSKEEQLRGIPASSSGSDFRMIVGPDDDAVECTLRIIAESGGRVRYLTPEQRGKIRYFVNDREFLIFTRDADDRFSGLRGKDEVFRCGLKGAFEDEWDGLPETRPDYPLKKTPPDVLKALEELLRTLQGNGGSSA